ncbi:MAG: class II fructose-bisphosphate aldolase [Verrucomicrobiota bacterium]
MTKNIDTLVKDLVMTDDMGTKEQIAQEIHAQAKKQNIYLSSIHDVYIARGKGKGPDFTVPAINLRCLTYDLARAIFRVAKKNDSGTFIFEIAKSEMGYTNQPPLEYAGVILGAAIKENYSGPVFIQGDHFQIKAKNYFTDPKKEVEALKTVSRDGIAAGFYNIDIDSSTIVDLQKSTLAEQQHDNCTVCAELAKYIRKIQPKGITVSVGGEIGEVGGKNSTVEELEAFMDGVNAQLSSGMHGLSKISVQTGTSHGGVVLPDGTVAKVKVDFDTLKKLSQFSKKKYGLGGAVQHGASTLPQEAFNKFPEMETIEIHLATNFQNMMYDSPLFPNDLKQKMYAWLKENATEERKEGQTEEQFIYKARKKALGSFKKDIMSLPENIRDGIAKEIEKNFDFLFKKLNSVNTRKFVNELVKPVDVSIGLPKAMAAVFDGEGDD